MADLKVKDPEKRISDLMSKASQQVRPFLVSAYVNAEYIRGNQNIRVNKDMQIENIASNSRTYLERKIFNRMSPIYLSRIGLLSANMPVVGFKQNGSSAGRFIDYTEGNRFLTDFVNDIDFKNNFHNKVVSMVDTQGLVFIKTGIDWNAGKKIGTYDVKVKRDKETFNYTQTVYEGRPWLQVCGMDEVFVDNYYVNGMEDINELVHRRLFTTEYIEARWGFKATEDLFDSKGGSRIGPNRNVARQRHGDESYAYVYEYYHKPNAQYPEGIYYVVINDKLITEILPLPFENSKGNKRIIPFDIIKLTDLHNYLVGPTVYNQIIPIQDTYNSVKNRVLEYINRIGISQIYAYENSLVDKGQVSNRPGAIFMLRRNAKAPQPVVQEKLGMEFLNYLQTLENDMLITAGISQLTAMGMAKSNMRTDGVVDRITESDQNKLEHAIDNIGQAYVKVFKKIMYIEQMRERILTEQLNLMTSKLIDDYQMKYKLESVDVEQIQIVNRDFLMKDDQYINSKFMQAMNLGVYNPEFGLSYVQKVSIMEKLSLGAIINTLDPAEVQTNQIIREEHEEIEIGLEPEVEEWHIHQQHIYEHNLYRQSPYMRKLRRFDEEKYKLALEILDSHIKQHEEHVAQTQDNFGAMMQNANSSPEMS